MILLSACTNDSNKITKKDYQKVIASHSAKNQSLQNDLLYRKLEYDIGDLYQTDMVEIDTALISQDIESGDDIIVVYNDELFKEVPIFDASDETIQIELNDVGYYGFFLRKQQGEIYDIGHAVNQCSSSENNLLWIERLHFYYSINK